MNDSFRHWVTKTQTLCSLGRKVNRTLVKRYSTHGQLAYSLAKQWRKSTQLQLVTVTWAWTIGSKLAIWYHQYRLPSSIRWWCYILAHFSVISSRMRRLPPVSWTMKIWRLRWPKKQIYDSERSPCGQFTIQKRWIYMLDECWILNPQDKSQPSCSTQSSCGFRSGGKSA